MKKKGKEDYKTGVNLEGGAQQRPQPVDDGDLPQAVDADKALADLERAHPEALDPIAAAVANAGLKPEDVGEVNKNAGMDNVSGSIAADVSKIPGDPAIQGIGAVNLQGYDMVEAKEDAILMCAKICHAVVKAYNDSFGEVTMPWDEMRTSCVKGVRFVLDNPGVTPEQQHESWLAEKLENGWVYGPTKSLEHKTHPCIRSYAALPPRQKAKDVMFGAIVRTFFGL